MTLTVACEQEIDYAGTADLMTQAFALGEAMPAARLEWLYEHSFSLGTTVIALREGERKVGQIAMVRQALMVNGRRETAAQLVDLFILPGHRGKQSLRLLYDEVGRQFARQNIRFAIGMPNAKALGVNAHFFGLQTHLVLPVSVGFCLRAPTSRDGMSLRFDPRERDRILPVLAQFRTAHDDDGLIWDETILFDRLSRPGREYGIHVVGNLLLISFLGRSRGIVHTLLCGALVRTGRRASQGELDEAVRAACRMWKSRLFVYVGVNDKLPGPPGMVLPRRVRPSPMLVQLRDFEPDRAPFRLDRYELIDFDYA
jgi:hypothetical protein